VVLFELDAWRSTHGRGPDGAVHSVERVRTAHAVVEHSRSGALRLGDRYWSEVAEASVGAVRRRGTAEGIELRLFGFGPCLLRFGPPELEVAGDIVSCRSPVRGGLLARRPGGALTLTQVGREESELRAAVSAFVPRLAFPLLYDRLQHRLHVRISQRYFYRLIAEAAR
jgi:hypothetical protein